MIFLKHLYRNLIQFPLCLLYSSMIKQANNDNYNYNDEKTR